ncbi:FKBP-type peptidyl-prolyl cis-trans isomerase [Leeuwenhoekiella sp. H156]|uniref:FKBP-type peptidyl-prolyl cis-trans isomerase n=1 Tax=Leeuwenhoekiella sp. H156 TaxID=3450128 RepID=UPI003FA47BEC
MMKNTVFAALGLLLIVSCNKDDDGPSIQPPRDRGEVQLESEANIRAYLQTHTYNYEEFETPAADFDYEIVFDTIAGSNATKTPLIDHPNLIATQYEFQDVNYTLYVLVAKEGAGAQPSFADSTYVNYQGNIVGDSKFDGTTTPIWFNLPETIFGYGNGLKELKAGTQISLNEDGTFNYGTDYGVGAVFIPSGLGYFSTARTLIPAYSDLVFRFKLYGVNQADQDNDGVPNAEEDINKNSYLYDVADDTDGDGIANFEDIDDDGDGILTRDEIDFNENGNAIRPFRDSNSDGTPDYLDPDN